MDFFSHWNIFWTVTYSLIAIVITVGSLATIAIFVKRKLLDRARFLILSLGHISENLSVPPYIAVVIHQEYLQELRFQCIDIFTGVVSIFTLASISLERMHAILWPLRHRTLTLRFCTCVIGILWAFGLLGMSFRLLIHFHVISLLVFSIMITTFFVSPLLITVIAYILIWRKQRRRLPSELQADDQDKK